MLSPISFGSTYKISSADNNGRTSEIFRATDTIYAKHKIDSSSNHYYENGTYKNVWTIVADDSYDASIDKILSSKGINFTRLNSSDLNSIDGIKSRIKVPKDYAKRCQLVEIDTKKFNDEYKNHGFAYIGDKGNINLPERTEAFDKYLQTGDDIDASIVAVRDMGKYPEICFQDGRHRYAYYRDMGMEKIPVAMDDESISVAKQYGLIK